MTDNIFEAKRDRVQLLSGLPGSAPSHLRVPVPKAGVLGRYEDAEASRLRILAGQQKKSKRSARKLKERQAERYRTRIAEAVAGRIGVGIRGESQVLTTKPKAEEDLELMRDKLRNERAETQRKERESYIQVQRDYRRDAERARELDIQDRTAQAVAQGEWLKTTTEEAQRIADRQQNAALEDRRLRLQRDRIQAEQVEGRRQRGLEHRRLNEETTRFNADVNDRRQQRAADIGRHQRDLQAVQDRVARQDAIRAQEIEQQHELALGELAERGRQREQLHENERFKVDHQRQVDADRAVSDREREQTLQKALDLLRHNKPPEDLGGGEPEPEPAPARQRTRVGSARNPLGLTEEEREAEEAARTRQKRETAERKAARTPPIRPGTPPRDLSDESDPRKSRRRKSGGTPQPEPQQVPALPAPSSARDSEPADRPIPRAEEATQTDNPLHGAQPASPSPRRHQTADERLQDLLGQPPTASPPHRPENPQVGRPATPEREGD